MKPHQIKILKLWILDQERFFFSKLYFNVCHSRPHSSYLLHMTIWVFEEPYREPTLFGFQLRHLYNVSLISDLVENREQTVAKPWKTLSKI